MVETLAGGAGSLYLRIFELADTTKLVALQTSGIIRVALDLLFAASYASNGQTLSRLSSLGNSPVCINRFTINDALAVGAIVVKVAELSLDLGGADESGKEMGTCPDLGAQSLFA